MIKSQQAQAQRRISGQISFRLSLSCIMRFLLHLSVPCRRSVRPLPASCQGEGGVEAGGRADGCGRTGLRRS